MEAQNENLPLIERVNFLAIFSSNLDEFYRVRMPVLMVLRKLFKQTKRERHNLLPRVREVVCRQQQKFGQVLIEQIIPLLRANQVRLLYNEPIPEEIAGVINEYFYSQVLAYLKITDLDDVKKNFFPENGKLYFLLNLQADGGHERHVIINIPSEQLPRFFSITANSKQFIVFLDDVIRNNVKNLFENEVLTGCYSFKVTRDADLDLAEEYPGDLSEQIEKQLLKRDQGIATRFLHRPGVPFQTLEMVAEKFNLPNSSIVPGGMYHNLKDLFTLPVNNPILRATDWKPISEYSATSQNSLFDLIDQEDYLFHPPYHSYNTILRFFNEAASDATVRTISVSLYRVASDSRIVNALISAVNNGKKVLVILELKARFDEANNIRWAKTMKTAGIEIVYSDKALKVHAKLALISREISGEIRFFGLFGTGNFNERTATIYTDHILMTGNSLLLDEMRQLFKFLATGKKPEADPQLKFKHLLVAQFNMQKRFLRLIDDEIAHARQGFPAAITIKVNNLEERKLISKLYEASGAGVKVSLIVRGICCLIPGVKHMSENITVRRIVGRYLEHGRIFVFHNKGEEKIFIGSADWMDRNINRRIEVCVPVYQQNLKIELLKLIDLQMNDDVQAVLLGQSLENIKIPEHLPPISSQKEIYQYLKAKANHQPELIDLRDYCA
jgi:polyphosphate kinase